jgi:hypothetical protein
MFDVPAPIIETERTFINNYLIFMSFYFYIPPKGRLGQLDHIDQLRVNRALMVFLRLAGSPAARH